MRPLLIFIFILGSLSSQAQELRLENVEGCIQYARQHNLLLQAAQRMADAASETKSMHRAALLPQLRAVSNLDYHFSLPVQLIPAEILGGEPGTYLEASFGQPYTLNMGLEASMSVLNTSLWIGTQQAAAETQAAVLQLEQSSLSTAERVARAYFLTLLSREAVKMAEDTKAANDSLLTQALHRHRNGIIEPLELNRIRHLQLESARSLEESRNVYVNNLQQLKVLLGLEQHQQLILTEQLGPDQEIKSADLTYSNTSLPDYRLKEAMVLKSKLNWQRERSKLLPELSVYARYTLQAQRQAFTFTESDQPWFTIGTAGVKLEWPIFTGFYRLSSIRKTQLQYEAATLELQNRANNLQQEQQELQANFRQSIKSTRFAREAYELGNQNYQLASLKYEAGILPLDQLINVYHEKLRAQNTLLKALSDYLYYHALTTTRNTY